jgi:hypothetical protein
MKNSYFGNNEKRQGQNEWDEKVEAVIKNLK